MLALFIGTKPLNSESSKLQLSQVSASVQQKTLTLLMVTAAIVASSVMPGSSSFQEALAADPFNAYSAPILHSTNAQLLIASKYAQTSRKQRAATAYAISIEQAILVNKQDGRQIWAISEQLSQDLVCLMAAFSPEYDPVIESIKTTLFDQYEGQARYEVFNQILSGTASTFKSPENCS